MVSEQQVLLFRIPHSENYFNGLSRVGSGSSNHSFSSATRHSINCIIAAVNATTRVPHRAIVRAFSHPFPQRFFDRSAADASCGAAGRETHFKFCPADDGSYFGSVTGWLTGQRTAARWPRALSYLFLPAQGPVSFDALEERDRRNLDPTQFSQMSLTREGEPKMHFKR